MSGEPAMPAVDFDSTPSRMLAVGDWLACEMPSLMHVYFSAISQELPQAGIRAPCLLPVQFMLPAKP